MNKHKIDFQFMKIVFSYDMYDGLTETEINELVAISQNQTFVTLSKSFKNTFRHNGDILFRHKSILLVTHISKILKSAIEPRVRMILQSFLRSILDELEFGTNYHRPTLTNFVTAHPDMTAQQLAQHFIQHKMSADDNQPEENENQEHMIRLFQDIKN